MERSLRRLLLALPILAIAFVGCGGGKPDTKPAPGQGAVPTVADPSAPMLSTDPSGGTAAPGAATPPGTTPPGTGTTPPAAGTK